MTYTADTLRHAMKVNEDAKNKILDEWLQVVVEPAFMKGEYVVPIPDNMNHLEVSRLLRQRGFSVELVSPILHSKCGRPSCDVKVTLPPKGV